MGSDVSAWRVFGWRVESSHGARIAKARPAIDESSSWGDKSGVLKSGEKGIITGDSFAMHASLPALATARAAHIAAACLHTPCIAERRLPLGPARKPEATRVRADQDHLFRGGPWHALSSLARAHARVPAHLSTRPVTAQPSCVPERLRTCQHAPQTAFFPAACVPLPARRVPTSRTPRALHAPRACVLVAWAALHRLRPRIGPSGTDGKIT